MPRLQEQTEAEERRRIFRILHKIKGIICFSANVYQCNIAFTVVHVEDIYSYISKVAANSTKRVCASGWFVLPVGLYFRLVCTSGWFVRLENNNCTLNITIMFN